jgi:hypothetical protein
METLARSLKQAAQQNLTALENELKRFEETRRKLQETCEFLKTRASVAFADEVNKHHANAILSLVLESVFNRMHQLGVHDEEFRVFGNSRCTSLAPGFIKLLRDRTLAERFRLVEDRADQLAILALRTVLHEAKQGRDVQVKMLIDQYVRHAPDGVFDNDWLPFGDGNRIGIGDLLVIGIVAGTPLIMRLGEVMPRLMLEFGIQPTLGLMSQMLRSSDLIRAMSSQNGRVEEIEDHLFAGCTTGCNFRDSALVERFAPKEHSVLLRTEFNNDLERFRDEHIKFLWWDTSQLTMVHASDRPNDYQIWAANDIAQCSDPATGITIADLPLPRGVTCPINALRSRSRLLKFHADIYSHPLIWESAIEVAEQQNRAYPKPTRPLSHSATPLPFSAIPIPDVISLAAGPERFILL